MSIPSCSNKACKRFGQPMQRRPETARADLFACEACDCPGEERQGVSKAPIGSYDTAERHILDDYSWRQHGQSYGQWLRSGSGPFDNRRR